MEQPTNNNQNPPIPPTNNQIPVNKEFAVQTDVVQLPSKGVFYKSGKSEITYEYMTAKDEDILSNPNYINTGTAFDKLLERKIKDRDITVDELLVGDKNAILMALRINGYGADYEAEITDPDDGSKFNAVIDLEQIQNHKIIESKPNDNLEFEILLPMSKKTVTFRLLSSKEEDTITKKLQSFSKNFGGIAGVVTERLKAQIMSVNGERNKIYISNFVDSMPAGDSSKLRKFVDEVTPNLDMTYDFHNPSTGNRFRTYVPIRTSFFYPNSGL